MKIWVRRETKVNLASEGSSYIQRGGAHTLLMSVESVGADVYVCVCVKMRAACQSRALPLPTSMLSLLGKPG